MEKTEFIFTFYGRQIGAIGQFQQIRDWYTTETLSEAKSKLWKDYDVIRMIQINDGYGELGANMQPYNDAPFVDVSGHFRYKSIKDGSYLPEVTEMQYTLADCRERFKGHFVGKTAKEIKLDDIVIEGHHDRDNNLPIAIKVDNIEPRTDNRLNISGNGYNGGRQGLQNHWSGYHVKVNLKYYWI